jgi:hypothetical protein
MDSTSKGLLPMAVTSRALEGCHAKYVPKLQALKMILAGQESRLSGLEIRRHRAESAAAETL